MNYNDEENEEEGTFGQDLEQNTGANYNPESSYNPSRYNKLYNKAKNRQDSKTNRANKQRKKSVKKNQKAQSQLQKAQNHSANGNGLRANFYKKSSQRNLKKAEKAKKKAQKLEKAAKKAEKVAKFAAKIGKFVATIGWIIVLVICIIGLVVFILTGVGYIIEGLKEIAKNLWIAVNSVWKGSENIVTNEEIIDVANFLQQMGYDLYDYGFVTKQDAFVTNDSNTVTGLNPNYMSFFGNADKNSGVYSYLTTYLVSDNYAKTVRNNNKNFMTAFQGDGILKSIGHAISGLNSASTWGSGFITVYEEEDNQIGKRGKPYGKEGADDLVMIAGGIASMVPGGQIIGAVTIGANFLINYTDYTSSIKISDDAKYLEVNGPGLLNSTKMRYELNGWTGRYSMPLEFLLATHIATMAPDLSYKLALTYDTQLEMLIHHITEGNINAGVQRKGDESSRVTRTELAARNDSIWTDVWDWADEISLNEKEILAILQETNIDSYHDDQNSKYYCTGPTGEEQTWYVDFVYTTAGKSDEVSASGMMTDICEQDKKGLLQEFDKLAELSDVEITFGNTRSEIEKTFWTEPTTTTENADGEQDTTKEESKQYRFEILIRHGEIRDKNDYAFEFAVEFNGEVKDIFLNSLDGDPDITYSENSKEVAKSVLKLLEKKIKKEFGTINKITDESIQNMIDSYTENEWWGYMAPLDKYEYLGELYGVEKAEDEKKDETTAQPDNSIQPTDAVVFNKGLQGKYKDEEVFYTLEIKLTPYGNYSNPSDIKIDRTTNYQAGWSWYIILTRKNKDADILCSDSNNTASTKACPGCVEYVKEIYAALNSVNETDLDTYLPYINCVRDHWFRNVYFTKASIENDTLIDTDTTYEQQTGERWTLYETYTGVEGEISASQYKLYVYKPNSNGEYYTNLSDADVDSGTGFYKPGGTYILCKYVGEGGSWELDEDGVTYIKAENSDGEYELVYDDNNYTNQYVGSELTEFRVGKKAKTISSSGIFQKGQNETAYKFTTHENKTWRPYQLGDSANENEHITTIYNLGLEMVYQADYSKIVQVEDGVRGQTQAKTKRMFLDEYYLYDGSRERAALIESAKDAIKAYADTNSLDPNDPDTYRKRFTDGMVPATTYIDENGKTVDVPAKSIDDITGPISLSKTALSAFAILENMHTLDAEYIYHDFKELVVELNYFNKEELSESLQEVMMFPILESNSAGWPDGAHDKSEDFYGTLIHSAKDYESLRTADSVELAKISPEDIPEENSGEEEEFVSAKEIPADYDPTEDGGYAMTTSEHLLVKAAKDIAQYMQINSYEYSQENRASSFENSQKEGCGYVDCSGFVSWCLQEVGIFGENQMTSSGQIANDLPEDIKKYYHKVKYGEVTDYATDLEPGTICIYEKHVNIYVGVYDKHPMFCDAGETAKIQNSPTTILRKPETLLGYIYIPNYLLTYDGVKGVEISGETETYAGYEEGNTVIAPASGEVIKYGTVQRENLETEDEDDFVEVGFIKIKLFDIDTGLLGRGCTAFLGRDKTKVTKDNYDSKNDKASDWIADATKGNYSEDDLKKLGYDYFWEEYADAAIVGHVLYIEGFKPIAGATDVASLTSIFQSGAVQNDYKTSYKVPNLLDDKKEFELRVAQAAKEEAAPFLVENGKLYIKEGTTIGTTYGESDGITADKTIELADGTTQALPVGNYLRMILRDLDDEVVENVEEYVEVAKSGNSDPDGIYGESLIAGESIDIPQAVIDAQDGYEITYEAINRKELALKKGNWSPGTVQRALYELWVRQGMVATNGTEQSGSVEPGLAIINIDGKDYVPIALKETFGKEGDYIQVVLEDGTILDCIMMDAKGTDDGSYIYQGLDYGHSDGNYCNILEVLIKGVPSGDTYTAGLNKDKLSWWGKNVVKIINGGPIFKLE